ncbi:MAG: BamA/TamA family outer membrane protein [Candidatus Sulfomarinibacteraceae bacterium]
MHVEGSGSLDSGGRVAATVDLRVDDVATALGLVEPWFDLPPELVPGGGPIVGSAVLSGTTGDPRFETRLEWPNPMIVGRELDLVRAEAEGDRETIAWSVEVTATPESRAVLDGTLDVGAVRVDGSWRVELDRLESALALAAADTVELPEVSGSVRGDGVFAWTPEEWRIEGRAGGAGLAADVWVVDQLELEFAGGPDALAINEMSARLYDGRLTGRGEVGLGGVDAPLELALDWSEVDLGAVPVDLPDGTAGRVNGRLSAGGTLGRPTAEVELDWAPDDPSSPTPPISAAGSLEDGVLRLVTREVSTDVVTAIARATVPLGGLPRPAWLWPDAADEPVRVTVDGHNLRSEPILALLGVEPVPVSASAELTVDAAWHPTRREETKILAELTGFRLRHPGGEIEAQGPMEFHMDGERVRLEPVVLTGPQTRIEIGGEGDLKTGAVDGRLEAVVAPTVARLIPYPVQIYRPIQVAAQVSGTMDSPRAAINVSHPDGVLVMRDPPLQIRDLALTAQFVDGRLWFDDGRAEVNQGRVELGGGWDPESGQGIVAEIDNVVVFVEGILSQWSGTLAIEPEPGRLARITGELNLVAGLWDQDVSLGGALFGPASLDPAGDDPLFDIALDIDVRGRGIVRVENNLGRFDARWDVLRVTGSAALPEMRGKIDIAPGGRFSLAGPRVTVRRGSLVFTGDPGVDPIVEIVPESDIAAFGSGGDRIDTASIATQGLVGGLAGALGFENETLQPAEISVEVEKDSSQQLMLGQRISHNIALFFATNTSDVQDRTSMLQLWNLPGLKGLSLQGYQKTLSEEAGGNLIQRFQWGGSSLYEDRPVIRKLKLEGDWPIGKRRLKKATGFRRGQPYDPFLTFVAKVRMERELAGAGFQEATVTARAEESNNAWTMFFECDPGPAQRVVFEGHEPPKRIRREVTALYQPPPLENYGFRNMRSLLDRHYDAEGTPDTEVVIERRGDMVVATVSRGDEVELTGPVLIGAPEGVMDGLRHRLGSSTELALLASDEVRAKRVVERTLTDLGYPGAVVRSVTKVGVGKGLAEVRIEADLGDRAVVSSFVLTGEDPLGLTRAEGFQLREGQPITRGAVDLAASQLRARYDGAGYSDAEVSGTLTEDPEGGWRVALHIEPGRRRKLEAVEIVGLEHTSPKVIRSGITVEEGEILRNSDLDTTAVRIANFAPVERVDVRTVPQGVDGAKVVMEVAEKPRWTTEVGGGWSTERGAQARFGIRDDNLIGRGLSLNFRGRWDRTEWLGFVVASLPPPPGKRFSFTTTGGYSRGDAPGNPDLTQDETFWSFEVTRWMGRGDVAIGTAGEQITGYYRFTRTHTYENDPGGLIPIDITNKTGLLGVRYVHDRFDSPFDPTTGYGVVLDAATSRGVFGSDVDYWTALGNGSTAMGAPLESTWIQSLRLGVAEPLHNQALIPEARFFAGGQGSIRGFDRDSVGPVAPSLDDDFNLVFVPDGGGALVILNEELRIPVWGGLRAALFADIGQVWPSWGEADWSFAVGAGVGIRWATPIGPVWADVAWPVVNPTIDLPDWANPATNSRPMSSSKPKFYVGIGRPF